MSDDAPNALGLEFSQPVAEEDSSGAAPASPVSTTAETTRKEKKPYVNPDRFRTGGTQRVCYFPGIYSRFYRLLICLNIRKNYLKKPLQRKWHGSENKTRKSRNDASLVPLSALPKNLKILICSYTTARSERRSCLSEIRGRRSSKARRGQKVSRGDKFYSGIKCKA